MVIDITKGNLTLRSELGKKNKVFYMYKGKPKDMVGANVGS